MGRRAGKGARWFDARQRAREAPDATRHGDAMRALASAPRARRRRSKIARDTAARDSTREFQLFR
jgi:hypothetical protein